MRLKTLIALFFLFVAGAAAAAEVHPIKYEAIPVAGTKADGTAVLVKVNDDATLPTTVTNVPHVIVDSAPTTAVTTAGSNPCWYPGATLLSVGGSTSGTSAVQLIALSGTAKIYVCSLTVIGVSGTTPTFSLVQGTGSNCASNQSAIVPAWTTTAGQLYAFAHPVAVTNAGYAVCYLNTGTTPVQRYQITYVQQ